MRQALQEARSDFIRPFRLPPKALQQLSQLRSEQQRIYQSEHRSAGVAELAERTRLTRAQAESLVAADGRVRSLDEPVETGAGQVGAPGDLLEDPLSAEAYEQVIDSVAGEQLRALLARLTEAPQRDMIGEPGASYLPRLSRSESLLAGGEHSSLSSRRCDRAGATPIALLPVLFPGRRPVGTFKL